MRVCRQISQVVQVVLLAQMEPLTVQPLNRNKLTPHRTAISTWVKWVKQVTMKWLWSVIPIWANHSIRIILGVGLVYQTWSDQCLMMMISRKSKLVSLRYICRWQILVMMGLEELKWRTITISNHNNKCHPHNTIWSLVGFRINSNRWWCSNRCFNNRKWPWISSNSRDRLHLIFTWKNLAPVNRCPHLPIKQS